jgi:nucleoid-associated protein YgaU
MTNSPPWRTGRRRYIPAPSTASPALVPPASAPPTTQHRYTVTKWDVSLVQVARVMYDDASLWPKIWLANLDQVPDPDVIRPGQQLRIPDKGPLNFEERRAEERYRTGRHP